MGIFVLWSVHYSKLGLRMVLRIRSRSNLWEPLSAIKPAPICGPLTLKFWNIRNNIYMGQSTVLNLFWEVSFHFGTDLYKSIHFFNLQYQNTAFFEWEIWFNIKNGISLYFLIQDVTEIYQETIINIDFDWKFFGDYSRANLSKCSETKICFNFFAGLWL